MNRFENDREEKEAEAAEGMILDLARLRPATPHQVLRERIAADLAAPRSRETTSSVRSPTTAPRSFAWLAERMLWAVGGAIAAAVPLLLQPRPLPAEPQAIAAEPEMIAAEPQVVAAEPQVDVAREPFAEESLAWSDDGVHFLDGQIPARVIRHWVLERFPGADGEGLVRPREDVFVVPVALR